MEKSIMPKTVGKRNFKVYLVTKHMQINKLGPFKLILRGKERTLLAFVLLREHIYTPLLSVNEMINVKYLTQCLAHRKHPIYGCCYLNTYFTKKL